MDYQLIIFLAFISIMIVAIVGCILEYIAFKTMRKINIQEECCAEETVHPSSRYVDQ